MKTKSKNPLEPYVYFALHGENFDPNIVTKKLGIEPTNAWKKGDLGQYLSTLNYSCWKWSTEKVNESTVIDKLVDEVVEKLKDKIEIINNLKDEFHLESTLVIVMQIDTNPEASTPALGYDLKTIEFLYRTRTVTDVDIYRYNSTDKE